MAMNTQTNNSLCQSMCKGNAYSSQSAETSGKSADKQSSYLSAAQGLVKLVFAAVCVEPLARGHAIVVFAPQELLLLDVFCQQQLEQHLELEAAMSGLTSPLLLRARCNHVAAPPLPLPGDLCQMAQVWNLL